MEKALMERRRALAFVAGLLTWPVLTPRAFAENAGDFAAFVETLRDQAKEAGVSRETFDSVAAALAYDPSLASRRASQGEFVRPLRSYVDDAANAGRVAKGKAMREKFAGPLRQVAQKYGVPSEMVVALWGMESDFGGARGGQDVLRSLATLAFLHRDNPVYAQEFVAGMVLLQKGVARDKLRGSWAGAMGDPQFMPSAYLKYARSYSGAGAPDIWSSGPDSLASIANFLRESGWRPGVAPLYETRVPANFDYATLQADFSGFARSGFLADGGALPKSGAAMLFFPTGAGGPAFLLSENFFVLKAYNFSDSYAFGASVLAERIAGRSALRQSWPAETQPLNQGEREAIQRGLTERGFYDGKIDGRFGPVTRLAIHAFQRRAGIASADGYPSRAVLEALRGN
jgi:lytic murein transglycosylase